MEWSSGAACVRSVAIPVTPVGDFVIRDDVEALVTQLTRQCLASRAFVPANETAIATLRGSGGLASRESFPARGDARSILAPWLLGLALALALLELFVRRRRTEEIRALRRQGREMASAA